MSIRNKRPQIQVEAVTDLVVQPEDISRKIPVNSLEPTSVTGKTQSVVRDSSAAGQLLEPYAAFPPTEKINLDDMFNIGKTASVDAVLNQLYSSDHFKKPKNRRKQA
jgi:hypothetical protein